MQYWSWFLYMQMSEIWRDVHVSLKFQPFLFIIICGYLLNPWSNFRYFTVHKLTESKKPHGMLIMCIQQIYIFRLIQITGNLINSSNKVVLNFFSMVIFGRKWEYLLDIFWKIKEQA